MLHLLYRFFLRPVFFLSDPETAHERVTRLLISMSSCSLGRKLLSLFFSYKHPLLKQNICNIEFPLPLGVAAGFDKTGELYPALSLMGFGFIESGTFTFHPQDGNPKPRLFRFPSHRAILNRMGFNNPGANEIKKILMRQNHTIPRGVNVGKSKIAEVDFAAEDYRSAIRLLAEHGDYVSINVSSPNTPGLRSLQSKEPLKKLLTEIQNELKSSTSTNRPLFVKIAPDLTLDEFNDIIEVADELHLSGIILTNTTLDKSSIPQAGNMEGGLSGPMLTKKSTEMIRHAYKKSQGRLVIIGVGGISSKEDALEKILAGASLLQIYTGYIYGGPSLPHIIYKHIVKECMRRNVNISQLVGAEDKI